jgi:hypothetical protein
MRPRYRPLAFAILSAPPCGPRSINHARAWVERACAAYGLGSAVAIAGVGREAIVSSCSAMLSSASAASSASSSSYMQETIVILDHRDIGCLLSHTSSTGSPSGCAMTSAISRATSICARISSIVSSIPSGVLCMGPGQGSVCRKMVIYYVHLAVDAPQRLRSGHHGLKRLLHHLKQDRVRWAG